VGCEAELHAYLRCGVFAHGFSRLRCDGCGHDLLVAFSCKTRGVCPSCSGRRMSSCAAHLVDRVVPDMPLRQFVLSLPHELRGLAAFEQDVLAVAASYRARAKRDGIEGAAKGELSIEPRLLVTSPGASSACLLAAVRRCSIHPEQWQDLGGRLVGRGSDRRRREGRGRRKVHAHSLLRRFEPTPFDREHDMKSPPAKKSCAALRAVTLLLTVLVALWPRAAFAADGDDPLKPFPLLERGIVVGAGLGLHAVGLDDRPRQAFVAPSGFAYLAILPAYWARLGDITKKYCASTGDAQDAANLMAAKRTYPNMSEDEIRTKLNAPGEQRGGELPIAGFGEDGRAEIERETGWDITRKGKCFSTRWGIFAALPTSFTTNVRLSDGTTASREIHPLLSFGGLFAVTNYFHVLGGVTLGRVNEVGGDAGRDERTISLFLGGGTTVDIVSHAFAP